MNIHHLRCAVMVARHGSQTRAAEVLYMSQPNLSKALKDLEQNCGFRIFSRTAAGMIPTRKGEEFLFRARAVLEQMDAMDAIYQRNRRTTAYLSVSAARASYISHAFTEFVNSLEPHCEMELNFRETNTDEVVHDILSREVDIGIIRYPLDQQDKLLGSLSEQGLSYVLYWKFRHMIIMSKRHPLAREKALTKAQLQPYIEISHGDYAQPIHMEDWQADAALEQRQIHLYDCGSQLDLLSGMAASYMWVSPMPKDILAHRGLVQIPSADAGDEYQDALIYLKGYALSKWEQTFYSYVRKEIER